jgi:hypothetical protein
MDIVKFKITTKTIKIEVRNMNNYKNYILWMQKKFFSV